MVRVFLRLLAQLTIWNMLPNSHYVTFYNFWGGRLLRPGEFRARLANDLTAVLKLAAEGAIDPPIGAKFPLVGFGGGDEVGGIADSAGQGSAGAVFSKLWNPARARSWR
jgi:hypothetical protein